MNLEDFENLGLIPELLEKMKIIEDRLRKLTPPVTTKQEVAKFLNVTPRTINNYITRGFLREGYHFHRKSAKIIVFVESAILEFRDELSKGMVDEKIAV